MLLLLRLALLLRLLSKLLIKLPTGFGLVHVAKELADEPLRINSAVQVDRQITLDAIGRSVPVVVDRDFSPHKLFDSILGEFRQAQRSGKDLVNLRIRLVNFPENSRDLFHCLRVLLDLRTLRVIDLLIQTLERSIDIRSSLTLVLVLLWCHGSL